MTLSAIALETDSPLELSGYDVVWTGLVAVLALGAVAVVLTAVVLLLRSSHSSGTDHAAGSADHAAAHSIEERLAEIDALAEHGTITEAERQAARTRIIGSV